MKTTRYSHVMRFEMWTSWASETLNGPKNTATTRGRGHFPGSFMVYLEAQELFALGQISDSASQAAISLFSWQVLLQYPPGGDSSDPVFWRSILLVCSAVLDILSLFWAMLQFMLIYLFDVVYMISLFLLSSNLGWEGRWTVWHSTLVCFTDTSIMEIRVNSHLLFRKCATYWVLWSGTWNSASSFQKDHSQFGKKKNRDPWGESWQYSYIHLHSSPS